MTRPPHWVVVCEEELIPVTTGCRVDHVGFLRAAAAAGVTLDVVVPLPSGATADGYDAALPGLRFHPIPRASSPVRHLGALPFVVASRPLPPGLAEVLGGDVTPDAVISYSVRSAEIGRGLAARLNLPHLIRCQNLDSAYFDDLRLGAPLLRRTAYRIEAAKLRRYERRLNADPAVSAFADVSAQEADAHRRRTQTTVLHVPSFAFDADPAPVAPGPRSGVLFLGSLDVETNQQAVEWLLTGIWPRVLAADPEASLQVVGRRPGPGVRAAVEHATRVSLHGDVPDVAPYLAAAAVVVNPVRTGAGINVKLLQGMAAGAAAVSSTAGASGLDWVPGEHLLVADTAMAFADAVLRLLSDDAYRTGLATAGQDHVRRRLDPRRGIEAFAAALGTPLV